MNLWTNILLPLGHSLPRGFLLGINRNCQMVEKLLFYLTRENVPNLLKVEFK